jgi:ABC-type tungstate transport system permease subunit
MSSFLTSRKTGYTVKTVAVGSGEAMKMGQECNADVLLVHSPAAEKEFMSNNYGLDRRLVMHNDFIIVGPASDPAGIKGLPTSTEAFTKIAIPIIFISRSEIQARIRKKRQSGRLLILLLKASGILNRVRVWVPP